MKEQTNSDSTGNLTGSVKNTTPSMFKIFESSFSTIPCYHHIAESNFDSDDNHKNENRISSFKGKCKERPKNTSESVGVELSINRCGFVWLLIYGRRPSPKGLGLCKVYLNWFKSKVLKKNIIFVVGIAVLFAMVLIVSTIYDKPHRDITGEESTFHLSVDQIHEEFVENQNAAYQKYNEQIVQLVGNLGEVENRSSGPINLLLKGNSGVVSCEMTGDFLEKEVSQKPGDAIVIKGLFVGYDDLLGELQFKKCSVVEN